MCPCSELPITTAAAAIHVECNLLVAWLRLVRDGGQFPGHGLARPLLLLHHRGRHKLLHAHAVEPSLRISTDLRRDAQLRLACVAREPLGHEKD
eukprot:SAG11_NODE_1644_length_4526_cov_1.563813_7_plen_93_part_01